MLYGKTIYENQFKKQQKAKQKKHNHSQFETTTLRDGSSHLSALIWMLRFSKNMHHVRKMHFTIKIDSYFLQFAFQNTWWK